MNKTFSNLSIVIRSLIICNSLLFLSFTSFAQISETEPNGMPDEPGVITIYEDSQISGSADFEEDYWSISKSPNASGHISLFISNEIGVGATPLYLEQRIGGYEGPVNSTITAHDGSAMPQFVSLDYTIDYYYVLRSGDMMQSGGSYSYTITGFNPATCSAPPTATAVTSSSTSATTISIGTITGSSGDGYVIKLSSTNSFTAPTDGFDLPTSEGTTYSGTGEQVIYIGDGTPNITISNLSAGTTYYIAAYNYVDCSGYYEFASAYTTTETTCGIVPTTATDLNIAIESSEKVKLKSITGEIESVSYVVKMNTTNSFTAPADGTLPSANTTYAGGEQVIYAGSSATPNELITGLIADTEYFFSVFTASDCGGNNYFETTGYTTSLTTCNFTGNIASGVVMSSTSNKIMIDSFNPLTTNESEVVPDGYIITITDGEPSPLQNGTALPTADTDYSNGGQQVVYVGNSTTPQIDISGESLDTNIRYYFAIYAYYTSCGSSVYQQLGYYFSIEYENSNPTATVTFDDISKVYGEDDFQLSATATSPITYRLISQTGEGTSIVGNTVTIGSPGTVLIEAQAQGNIDSGFGVGNTIATLTIGKADPVLSFDQVELAGQSTYILSASTNTDGVLSYSLPGTTNGHSLSGTNNEILTSSGTLGAVRVQVSAAESDNFNARTADGFFTLTNEGGTFLGVTDESIYRLQDDGTIDVLNSIGDGLHGTPVFANQKVWFVSTNGGTNGGGAIMSYDEAVDVLTTEYALDGSLDGTGLSHGLILYQNKLWGVTDGGSSGVGFFSYDPFTNTYELVSILSNPEVSQGSELFLLGGQFYLGEKNDTDIIEIDPSDGSHSSVHTLSSGQLFAGIGLGYIDDQLMMATTDGSNDYIYAVDLGTQIGQTLATFGNSRNPSHVIDANGEIWGVNTGDSLVNEWGSVFSMDYNGSNFTTVHSFSSMSERLPGGKLSFANNTIYGFTIKDGTSDHGAAFNITTGGSYTKLGALTGLNPSLSPAGLGREFQAVDAYTTFEGQTLLVQETIALNATSSSNGNITFALDEGDGTLSNINGNNLTGGMPGMTTVFAYVAATSLYEADTVQATFTIERRNRNISPEDVIYTYGDGIVKLDFNIPEGETPNTYQLLSNNTGSSITGIDGDSLILGTPGTDQLSITAHEDMQYNEEQFVINLIIEKASSSLAFPLIPMKTAGETFVLSDTTQQGLPVTYSSSNISIATVSGHTVNVVGAGEVNIIANVVGNALYEGLSGYSRKLTAYRNPTFKGAITTVENNGVVFVNKEDSLYYLRNMNIYTSSLGSDALGHVILSNNQIWGMTRSGGAMGEGIIFKMNTDSSNYSVVHDFGGNTGDGPQGGLVESDGKLWGMTRSGGDNARGAIFHIDTTGANLTVVHHFIDSTGSQPYGSLLESNGKIWGMTNSSRDGAGVIFSIEKDGSNYTMHHDFENEGVVNDGASPWGNLMEYNGRIFGVTKDGGTNDLGTLFSLNLNGKDYTKHFDFGGSNGEEPHGQLTYHNNRLYGLAAYGGDNDNGTIYSVETDGSGFEVEFSFPTSPDGEHYPLGWLTLIDDIFWGVTNAGGVGTSGTIFQYDPESIIHSIVADLDVIPAAYPAYTTILPLYEEDSTQSVAFEPVADPIYGDTIIVNASASSGLAITLSSSNTEAAMVNGDTIFTVGTGQVNITATQSGDSFWHAADSTISFTVQQRMITVTADPQSKTYGNVDPDVLTYQITSGELINGDVLSGSLSRVSGEDIGDYEIQQGTLSASGRYTLTYISDDLTINPKPLTVTADAMQTKVYGEADAVFAYTITTGSLESGDGFSGELNRVTGEDVGDYEIQQGTLDPGSNYTITYVSNIFFITPKSITVTADADQTKVYGESDPIFMYSIIAGSLVNGDVLNGSLTRVTGEDVGDYEIQQGTLGASDNYNLTYLSGNLTINQRPITIKASDKSKTYGSNDSSLHFTVTSGSLAPMNTFDGTLERESGEDVGDYLIQVGSLRIKGGVVPPIALQKMSNDNHQSLIIGPTYVDHNYDITFLEGTFSISVRPLTVTADTDQTKVYGEIDPVLTYSITTGSLVSGDALSGLLARVAGEDVGDYEIQQGTLDAGGNYSLTYVPDDFTISPKLITVTADASQTKIYGESDPIFTYSITTGSLVNGDVLSGVLSRVASEDVGDYEIQQGTLDAGGNYSLTYVPDDFTISPKLITVTADAGQTKVYGEIDPVLTYSITTGSLVSSDALSGLLTRIAGEDVGDYEIQQGTLDAGGNYALSYVSDDLAITPKSITVTANPGQSKEYNSIDPAFSFTITSGSLEAGDSFTGTLNRESGEDLGVYDINIGTLSLNNNYLLDFVSNEFTIVQATASITISGLMHVYDDTRKEATVTTSPVDLDYTITYNGNAVVRNAGTYTVEVTINEINYTGFASDIFVIEKGPQTITFNSIPHQNIVDNSTLELAATITSNLVIDYESLDETIATIDGNIVTFLEVGTVNIRAHHGGNGNYLAAPDVIQTLNINELYIWSGENWNSGSTPPDNKDLRFDARYNLSDNSMMAATMEVTNGGWIEIGNGGVLTTNGGLTNDGLVEVYSGGSLVTLGSVSGSNYKIHKTTTFDEATGQYSIVGSPVQNSGFVDLGSNALVYGYDNSETYNISGNQGLDRFKTPSQLGLAEMQVGEGYFSAFTGDANGAVTFIGTPHTGTINKSLSFTDHPAEEDAQEGFNLVANPYPSAISFAAFMTDNSGSDISGSIYLWDDNNSNSTRGSNADYVIVNSMGNTDSQNIGLTKWDGHIRSGQGFFVQANSSTSLTFNNNMRILSNNDDAGFYRTTKVSNSIKLILSNEENQKATVVGFAQDATIQTDKYYDAVSLSQSELQLYSMQPDDTKKMGIQGLPIGYAKEIKLGFTIPEAGQYMISIANVKELQDLEVVLLKDHLTNRKVNLKDESYSFNINEGENTGRFTIQVSPSVVSSIDQLKEEVFYAYSTKGQLNVVFETVGFEEASFKLFDLTSQVVYQKKTRIESNKWQIETTRIPVGVYILMIETDYGIWKRKVITK